jgi:Undecaprenyl-phosphate galactose phosphotransferase WbaP
MDNIVQKVEVEKQPRARAAQKILARSVARPWMVLVLLTSDMLSLLVAGSLALFLWSFVRSDLIPRSYLFIFPLIFVFALIYALAGLYPGIGVSAVGELRLLSISTTIVFLWLGTLTFYMHNFVRFSRAAFGLSWIIALILVPISRNLFRKICSSLGFWGEPIALIGFGERGNKILKFLRDHPSLGYRPVVIIDGFTSTGIPASPIPHYQEGNLGYPGKMRVLDGVKTAILITSEIPKDFLADVVEGRWHKFHHLVMISDDQNRGSVWVEPKDIGGILGLEVRQNLFSDMQQVIKRVVDLSLVILLSPFSILLFLFLAVLIKLNSAGPVFYRQKRIGKDGKEFVIWKFRTMLVDADQNFKTYLEQNSDHKAEWEKNQKIKNDPRVTQVGKMMRRLSLDELPQIINIFQGDMSLVGPRPIVDEEVQYYGNRYHLYTKVKPGLTGLWQVSGRNDTTYEQRVRYDEYYVRNWSIWIDIYILAQTIGAVLGGKGAY